MTRPVPHAVAYVGPGHARHAVAEAGVVCGADRRTDSRGQRPFLNHEERYRPENVDCKRCRKALGLEER